MNKHVANMLSAAKLLTAGIMQQMNQMGKNMKLKMLFMVEVIALDSVEALNSSEWMWESLIEAGEVSLVYAHNSSIPRGVV